MTNPILEAGALALLDAADLSAFWDDEHETRLVAGAVIAAVTPLIRAAALEEAAQEAEDCVTGEDAAYNIRALKEQP